MENEVVINEPCPCGEDTISGCAKRPFSHCSAICNAPFEGGKINNAPIGNRVKKLRKKAQREWENDQTNQ